MLYTVFAFGCFVGATFGVLIMALATKKSDERTAFSDKCQKCEVFMYLDGDLSKCQKCEKVSGVIA